jgi:hypothetical protein
MLEGFLKHDSDPTDYSGDAQRSLRLRSAAANAGMIAAQTSFCIVAHRVLVGRMGFTLVQVALAAVVGSAVIIHWFFPVKASAASKGGGKPMKGKDT